MALALYGAMGRVFMVTSERKARVPSDPTIRWESISKGSSYATRGLRLRPVTFLMLYL